MSISDGFRSEAHAAAAQGATRIGDVVMYDVSQIRIERYALRAVFDRHGFGACVPEQISLAAALARAVQRPVPRDMLVRPFSKTAKSESAVGIYLRKPGQYTEGGDDFHCGARVRPVDDRTTPTGKRFAALAPEGGDIDMLCAEVAEQIRDTANRLLGYAETTDVTTAAIAAITGPLNGVSMRDRGGVYFVTARDGDRWQRLAADLSSASNGSFVDLSFPMMSGDRAAKATTHVVTGALESAIADVTKSLQTFDPDKTRDSTVEKRIADAEALIAKAELFGGILGDKLDAIKADAAAVRAKMRGWLLGDRPAVDTTGAAEAADPFAFRAA